MSTNNKMNYELWDGEYDRIVVEDLIAKDFEKAVRLSEDGAVDSIIASVKCNWFLRLKESTDLLNAVETDIPVRAGGVTRFETFMLPLNKCGYAFGKAM